MWNTSLNMEVEPNPKRRTCVSDLPQATENLKQNNVITNLYGNFSTSLPPLCAIAVCLPQCEGGTDYVIWTLCILSPATYFGSEQKYFATGLQNLNQSV